MNDVVDVGHGADEAILVAHVAEEEAELGGLGFEDGRGGHLGLLELVAREDDDFRWIEALEDLGAAAFPEGSGAASDHDCFAV